LIKKINNRKRNFQNNNATFFNPNWSNKIYFKGPDRSFYEFENQNIFQNKAQRHEYKHVVSLNTKFISKEKPKIQTQVLKENYQKKFVKGSEKSHTCVFYNYYCHIDHISLDYKLRKENNFTNVV
jgi:hypothetical protein